MKQRWLLAIGPALALLLAGGALAALQDENVLVSLPGGFKLGYHAENAVSMISEFIPAGETVEHWSRMLTELIHRDQPSADPEASQSAMLGQWTGACPGGQGARISDVLENGYRVSYWSFTCPLNPATRQPEFMVRKVISGADATYEAQFAYREQPTPALIKAAESYLRRVVACDTRSPEHPCPSGM